MNKVVLSGNVTRPMDVREAKDQTYVIRFTVAVNRYSGKDTDFFDCVAFRKTADRLKRFYADRSDGGKGQKIAVSGSVQLGSYQNQRGENVRTVEVVVDDFDLLAKKEDGASGSPQWAPPQGQAPAPKAPAEDPDGFMPIPDDDEELPWN